MIELLHHPDALGYLIPALVMLVGALLNFRWLAGIKRDVRGQGTQTVAVDDPRAANLSECLRCRRFHLDGGECPPSDDDRVAKQRRDMQAKKARDKRTLWKPISNLTNEIRIDPFRTTKAALIAADPDAFAKTSADGGVVAMPVAPGSEIKKGALVYTDPAGNVTPVTDTGGIDWVRMLEDLNGQLTGFDAEPLFSSDHSLRTTLMFDKRNRGDA